jgi:hypothetical protein
MGQRECELALERVVVVASQHLLRTCSTQELKGKTVGMRKKNREELFWCLNHGMQKEIRRL